MNQIGFALRTMTDERFEYTAALGRGKEIVWYVDNMTERSSYDHEKDHYVYSYVARVTTKDPAMVTTDAHERARLAEGKYVTVTMHGQSMNALAVADLAVGQAAYPYGCPVGRLTAPERVRVLYGEFVDNGDSYFMAVFPDLPGTYDPDTFLSYLLVGEHGSAHVSVAASFVRCGQHYGNPGHEVSIMHSVLQRRYDGLLTVVRVEDASSLRRLLDESRPTRRARI